MIKKSNLGEGVWSLSFDSEHSLITLGREANEQFYEVINEVIGNDDIKGVIVTSNKKSFIVGGNLSELYDAKLTSDIDAIVSPFTRAMRVIEMSSKPFVAAMPGTALGGGLELALACNYRISTSNPSSKFGFPEVTLGLMPGAGGTQRLPRLVGIEKATPLLVQGRLLNAEEAKELGILGALVPEEELISHAKNWILENGEVFQPWDAKRFDPPGFKVQSPSGRNFFMSWSARINSLAGGNDFAARSTLQAIYQGLERNLDSGLDLERREFIKLASGRFAKNKVRTLFKGVKKSKALVGKASGRPGYDKIRTLSIIGGGVMGRGIAQCALSVGINVNILDASPESANNAVDSVKKRISKSFNTSACSITSSEVSSKIKACSSYDEIAESDFVIEAIFEDIELKKEVLGKVSSIVGQTTLIASNTSTIPIAQLSSAVSNPGRFIGLHFFSPVDRMSLTEVIRTQCTDLSTIEKSLILLDQLGKTPVIVNDCLGFFTSRVVSAYSSEVISLVGEGISPQRIDNITVNAGFPIGGASLTELTTFPLLADILRSMRGNGNRIANKGSISEATLAKLIGLGRTGKPSGKGFYDYRPDGRQTWPGLVSAFPLKETLSDDTLRTRLFYSQSLEAARCIEEKIVQHPLDADMASVLGWNYPAHLGGPLSYIDDIGSLTFINECEELARRFGDRFTPPNILYEMKETGAKFHK